MIGCVDSKGEVTYITKFEDFESLVSSEVYSALCEWNDNISNTYKEKYEDLQAEYNSSEEDYSDKDYLEDENCQLENDIKELDKKVENVSELIKSFIDNELYYDDERTLNSYIKDRLNSIIIMFD